MPCLAPMGASCATAAPISMQDWTTSFLGTRESDHSVPPARFVADDADCCDEKPGRHRR